MSPEYIFPLTSVLMGGGGLAVVYVVDRLGRSARRGGEHTIADWPKVSDVSAPADALPLTEARVREIVREEMEARDTKLAAEMAGVGARAAAVMAQVRRVHDQGVS